jgi:Ankyrin repeats (3 copies)
MEEHVVGSPAYWRAWQASVNPPPLTEPAQQKPAIQVIKQHGRGPRLFADLQREQRARLEQAELEVNALLHKSEQHRASNPSSAGYCGRFGTSNRVSGAPKVSAVGHYDISSADPITRRSAPRCVFTSSQRNTTPRQSSAGCMPTLTASPVEQQHIAGAASFSQVDRFTSDSRAAHAGPGPAHYKPQVTALTDKAANFSYGKVFDSSHSATIDQSVDAHDWRVFGFGCSADEHVLYGQCLDGKCALRKRNEIQHHAVVLAAQRRQQPVPSTQATGRVTDFTTVSNDCSASLDATSLTSSSIVTGTTASTSASVRAAGRQSALHYACLYGDLQQVHSLCQQHGVDVAAVDERGCTPLHIAAERGHAACVKRLLDNAQHPFVTPCKYVTARTAPAVNARDARGRTPLMLACAKSHAAVVELLVEAGADCTLRDSRGKTTYDMLPRTAEELYQIVKCSADLAAVHAQLAAVEGLQQQQQLQQHQQQHHKLQLASMQASRC